jgi:cysteine desulfurase
MKPIYLDNNATTRVAPEVLDAMLPYLQNHYGNPSSMHTFGGRLHRKVEDARGQVAALIGAEPEEIIFTSCGTESDNTALMSAVESYPRKRHVVTTRVEHPAVLNFVRYLGRKGLRTTFVPVDTLGRLDVEALQKSLDDDTSVVSVMYANNETGVIFPIQLIGEIVKERGPLVHTDAVQAAGKIPINVRDLPVDMLSISGHKVHGPKGIGALFVKKGTRFHPFLIGGHQERGRRAGTENVASIIGFGKACEIAGGHLSEDQENIASMRDRLEQALIAKCPNTRVNGDSSTRLPNTANISFEYVEGESILLRLDEYGVCASSGSACTSGSLEPSHVLRAMGVPYTAIHGSIRFSLSRYNTDNDIHKIIEVLPPIIHELRALSPYGREATPSCQTISRNTESA